MAAGHPTLPVVADPVSVPGSPHVSSLSTFPDSGRPTTTPTPLQVSPKDRTVDIFRRTSDMVDLVAPDQGHPLSTTSTSSSSNPIFTWPSLTSAPPSRGRDPFDNTRSFSEDPFSHHSSSSSSGDDNDARPPPPTTTTEAGQPWQLPPLQTSSLQRDLPLNELRVYPPSDDGSMSFSRPTRNASRNNLPQLRPPPQGAKFDPWHSLSLELVDSLHATMQALLYVSPPHLLDNAKEQYAGCAIPMPTTTVSALLTSIRGLNYLSANLVPLCEGQIGAVRVVDDFDIGELLQNVADQLSGEAAQAEVELVLFHSDVGMKHISMTGDREGIGYVLSHVIRQILAVASKGDTIELGLQVIPQSPSMLRRVSVPNVDLEGNLVHGASPRPSSPGYASSTSSASADGPLLCVFEIVHNVAQVFDTSNAVTPKAELNPFTRLVEEKEAATPKLETQLCYRLLRQVNAWLKTDTIPSSPTGFGLPRHAYELSVVLPRASVGEQTPLSPEQEEARQPFAGMLLPQEPTLSGLAEFAETLRGCKTNLHASHTSIFARHLTSYLTAWGLDVSHIPVDSNVHTIEVPAAAKFVIIDEDITVLRHELLRLKPDTPPATVRQRSMKRPGLFRSAKSTASVRQSPATVIIHFTSLDKYHQVRDVVSVMGASSAAEVMVVPKPVGPRRLLTTLFTAVRQPFVDPIFSPIATSPRSPQIASGNRTPTGVPQEGFFDSVDMLHADPTPQKARSPLSEVPPSVISPPLRPAEVVIRKASTPAEVVSTSASEYFARSTTGKSVSGASGVIMQSPDGRPFGMFFEPPASGRSLSFSQRSESAHSKQAATSRRTSTEHDILTASTSPSDSLQGSRRTSAISTTSTASATTDDSARAAETEAAMALPSPLSARRKTLPTHPDAKPIVAQGRERSSTVTRRVGSDKQLPNIAENPVLARPPKTPDVVMPPINVLIVEDNPINQNILSMFFRRKKIKYQTAKDGVEAVEKWRTGGFHLILMDIQLPVMDGIEATKEIRKLEKNNNIGVFPSTPLGDHQRPIEVVASSPFRSAVIIVALTASSLQTDRVAALAAGCNDFLTKPVSLKWLEKKTVEWGCMQALIDFDGWRRWKGSDHAETKRGFQTGPQAAARNVASRLRIERSKGRPAPSLLSSAASSSSTTASTNTISTPAAIPSPALLPPPIGNSLVSSEEKPLPALPSE